MSEKVEFKKSAAQRKPAAQTLCAPRGACRKCTGERPEFVSRAILKWLHAPDIDTAPVDPCKRWQNGTNESFNGKFRDECLSLEWFRSRVGANVLIEIWHRRSAHPRV